MQFKIILLYVPRYIVKPKTLQLQKREIIKLKTMWKKHFNDIKTDRKEKSLYSSILVDKKRERKKEKRHIAKRERMNGAKEVECFDLKHC